MKYGYTVKYNGEYYPAGTEVPNDKREEKVEDKTPIFFDEDEVPKKKPGRPPKREE